ncbi:unnamed protein product, partial [Litomosoides sigmodontis]
QQQQQQTYMVDNYADRDIAYRDKTDLPTGLPVTQFVESETLLSYESEFPQQQQQQQPVVLSLCERASSSMSIYSTTSDDVTVDIHYQIPIDDLLEQQQTTASLPVSSHPEQEVSAEKPAISAEVVEREGNYRKPLNDNLTITKESELKAAHSQIRNATAEKSGIVRKEEKRERLKKPKPLSIRELQNAPIPVRPPKPKPPSKSQLLMEKLKASIEADKLKPKKDVKSKLHELLTVNASVRPPRAQQQTMIVNGNDDDCSSSSSYDNDGGDGGGGESICCSPEESCLLIVK